MTGKELQGDKVMKYYFAPMEGITGYIYRRAHREFFSGVDKYFTPFICPKQKKSMTPKEIKDILPEHNQGCSLVPQILTNCAEDFIRTAKDLQAYGYGEVNLNLGCPSQTVTAKRKGAGFLEFTGELERFLEGIFDGLDMKISIKTRLGKEDPEEFHELLRIYNQYPLEELIVHPRVQTDYYKNVPNLELFGEAVKGSRTPLCYNGDLFTQKKCREFRERFPEVDTLMLGRGLLVNPALVQELQGGESLEKETLKKFHDGLCEAYEAYMSGDKQVLFKMKELWFYMGNLFADNKKYLKKIKKSQKLEEYREIVEHMFESLTPEIPQ